MKTIAFYLPQFHRIPENDRWWGEGFTEWVNVKKARPLFEGHNQPRIPLNNNYYDLSNSEVMKWQSSIAKRYGIHGFCFYHYWFGGQKLLERPVENYFADKSIRFPFCFSWANEHWTNQWVSDKQKVLIEQKYGNREEWIEHFNYLLPFFLDDRYIRIDERPLFIIYKPELIDCRNQMFEVWNDLAKKNGLLGISFVYQRSDALLNGINIDLSMFDYGIEYQPITAFRILNDRKKNFLKIRRMKRQIDLFFERKFRVTSSWLKMGEHRNAHLTKYWYDEIWNEILEMKPLSSNSIPCAFVNWDNTPRRGERGSVVIGSTPEKFYKYMTRLIRKARNEYDTEWLFVFAWNEWAEGGLLEPDETYEFSYLQALEDALKETNELEDES